MRLHKDHMIFYILFLYPPSMHTPLSNLAQSYTLTLAAPTHCLCQDPLLLLHPLPLCNRMVSTRQQQLDSLHSRSVRCHGHREFHPFLPWQLQSNLYTGGAKCLVWHVYTNAGTKLRGSCLSFWCNNLSIILQAPWEGDSHQTGEARSGDCCLVATEPELTEDTLQDQPVGGQLNWEREKKNCIRAFCMPAKLVSGLVSITGSSFGWSVDNAEWCRVSTRNVFTQSCYCFCHVPVKVRPASIWPPLVWVLLVCR